MEISKEYSRKIRKRTRQAARRARSSLSAHPAWFIAGGVLAAGLVIGLLRARRPKAEIVFEAEGDWELNPDEVELDAEIYGRTVAARDVEDGLEWDLMAGDPRPERAMTPDIENISADHPSTPSPASARHPHETPVRSAFAGHETTGPGIRTGSAGAAAIDAGSAGPRQGEFGIRPMRRRAENGGREEG